MKPNSFMEKFTMVAMKIGEQIHLRSLRDAFAIIMPVFILAGVSVLVNNVVFGWFFSGDTLATAQYWGTVITNGTLRISGLLVAPMIAYCLSINRQFKNPIAAVIVAMCALIIMMPNSLTVKPVGADESVIVAGILSYANLGTAGMFAGIIVGLLATEAFIYVSGIKKLEIDFKDDNIPAAVGKSFSVLLPVIIVLTVFGTVSFALYAFFNTDLITLVSKIIQEPLKAVNTNLWGCVFIYSFGNFLFTLGIHQSVVNSSILQPILLASMNENMLAFANNQEIPHIINYTMVNTFGMIGGTGSTICLIIATLLFGKLKSTKNVARLGSAPGIFNINEPIIFGYPIVFNLPMMIPFVLLPALGIITAYAATAMGFMNKAVVLVPWTTPPLINAFLATAGDWRAVIVQLVIIVGGVFLYLPFMKINEKVTIAALEKEEE